jgi:hypothetical protein
MIVVRSPINGRESTWNVLQFGRGEFRNTDIAAKRCSLGRKLKTVGINDTDGPIRSYQKSAFIDVPDNPLMRVNRLDRCRHIGC